MPYPYTYLDRMEEERDARYEQQHKGENMSSELVKSDDYNYKSFNFHEKQEQLVDIIVKKTGREERHYFRVLVAYKFAEIATHMRTSVNYLGSVVPANVYAVDLASSGFSKDRAMHLLDKDIFGGFRDRFKTTFKEVSELNLQNIADQKAILEDISITAAEFDIIKKFNGLPNFLYSFGESTIEGYKALRLKLSMAGIGATSYILGEAGSSMSRNADALTELLNTFDAGESKQKLVKNDSNDDMYGPVPSNLFMFGTQSKLFDGGKIEEDFFNLLEEGYGRRLFFGYVENIKSNTGDLSAEELYDIAMDTTTDLMIKTLHANFEHLSDISYYNKTMNISKDVAMLFIKYKQDCEAEADKFKPHETVKKAVVMHGYWRAVKLAGAYAFIDETNEITTEQAKAAIRLVEESNDKFNEIARRPTAYVKLIEYMADIDREVTQVELVENLPFYKGSEVQKKELMTLAIAHGYRNKIVVKKTYSDGVEFFKAERLEETDLSKIMVSWSTDITDGYTHQIAKFEDLYGMVCKGGFHYTVCTWKDGHRNSTNLDEKVGFNLCVLDIDNGVSLNTAKSLLDDYTYLMYETKRSTPTHNRFRIIIPLSHTLRLDKDNFKEFMKNVFEFMPFDVDDQTADVARKWLSNSSTPHYNKGKLLDVYDFLPKTKKQEEMKMRNDKITNSDSVQRYFLLNHESGRNNAALKYALMLLDNGHSSDEAILLVRDFNKKLVEPLSEQELTSTIFKTIYKREAELELNKD